MTRTSWKIIFADNLVSILEDKGISQNQLAKDSGVSASMISDYINRFAAPTVFTIINIAYALDVEVDELVDFGDMIEY